MIDATAASEKNDILSNKDFPAISITLEEIRRHFDSEENRKQSLESKTQVLIGAIGIIITIVPFQLKSIAVIAPLYILLIIAALFSLLVLKLSPHKIPLKEYDDYYQYARLNEKDAMDKFLLSYIVATKSIKKNNDRKAIYLKVSFILTVIGLANMVFMMTFSFQ